MKTVQLLYSYMLIEKSFTLESQPSSPTKEKRFAYNLYLNFIFLLDRLSHRVKGKNNRYPLAETRFILKIENDDKIKSLINNSENNYPFKGIENEVTENIKNSLLFREFEKNKDNISSMDNFWEHVFNTIILPNPKIDDVIQSLSGYSLSGVERAKGMMEMTFSNFYSSKDNIDDALKILAKSLELARELYIRLLALPVELTRLRMDQLEANRKKLLATPDDINPNMRFVDNFLPKAIENNNDFERYTEDKNILWRSEDPELLEILLKAIINSDLYKNYIEGNVIDRRTDCNFWRDIFTEVILNNTDFLEYLENKSVFWNDDLEIMASFVLKTFKRFEDPRQESEAIMPMYKDGDNGRDAKFGFELFSYVIKNKELYRKYIEDALSHDKWEADRLAFMDLVITMTALAEIIHYPEIPVQVSINEYIEIAKSYSSEKSGQFINGLLASILPKLKSENIINKPI